MSRLGSSQLFIAALGLVVLAFGCKRESAAAKPKTDGVDAHVTTLGTIEVTAKLVEVPRGAIIKRDLYDYATILKYEVVTVHRGQVHANTIYVAQYNPFKPRSQAADRRVAGIGGTVESFQAGQIHRMALDVPVDDHFMGGLINKYFGQETGPLYWACWTNLAEP